MEPFSRSVLVWIGAAMLAFAPSLGLADSETRSVTLGMHSRIVLDHDMQRISVGNPRVLEVQLINSRELLALGKTVGRTNLLIWYADGTTEDMEWSVQRDLSVLKQVLLDIYPTLKVESAPDRNAIILRGIVPDIRYMKLAEAAATNYLRAGVGGGTRGSSLVLPSGEAAADLQAGTADGSATDMLAQQQTANNSATTASPRGSQGTAVINLIQVGDLPASIEERLHAAIDPLGGQGITVRRIVQGQMPNNAVDTFVLEGEVASQIELSRVLIAASTVITGRTSRSIQVLTNESGALAAGAGGGSGGSAGGGQGFGNSNSRAIGSAGLRNNQIRSNIARATALSAAGGRILAFIHVRDLPQVRVQVRVFEVNRTKLKDWFPAINAVKVDQGQPSNVQPPLIPGSGTTPGQSLAYGGTSWQMANRLIGGFAASQWQVVASDFALDVFMSLLESEGVARSLARPTLLVLSGESAIFNVGGAIPIQNTLTTAAGNQSFTDVNFQEFGITLAVRPLVGNDDVITMDVSPDISFPDPELTASLQGTQSGNTTTAFETRTLSTSTRLADGGVLAIGGLMQLKSSVTSSYTPKVQEVPGAGWLAKSLNRDREELEVVILLSPTIVRDPIDGVRLWAYPKASDLFPEPAQRSEKSSREAPKPRAHIQTQPVEPYIEKHEPIQVGKSPGWIQKVHLEAPSTRTPVSNQPIRSNPIQKRGVQNDAS